MSGGLDIFNGPVGTSPMVRIGERKYSVGENKGPKYVAVVEAAHAAYLASGRLPGIADIQALTPVGIGAGDIKKVLKSDYYRDAMLARGVPLNNFGGLDPEQLLVIQIVTNPTDKRALKDKLRSAGVTYPQYRSWLKQPSFRAYFNKITEGLLDDHIGDLHTVLMTKAMGGDLNAIKYVNELNGRHDPNRQKQVELQQVVGQLLDIILRNVKDKETLDQIATEFGVVMGAHIDRPGVVKGEIGK